MTEYQYKPGDRVRLVAGSAIEQERWGMLGTVVVSPTPTNEWQRFVLEMWPVSVVPDDGLGDGHGNAFVMFGPDEVELADD
jgi:hypothetical protein